MDQVRRGYTRGQHWASREDLGQPAASSNVPGLSTYNIKPQELRVSEVHADELQVQPPEEVVEFLRSIGREDCAVRVIEALGAAVGTTGEKSLNWMSELRAMQADGELDAFLDMCSRPPEDRSNGAEPTEAEAAIQDARSARSSTPHHLVRRTSH